MKVPQMKQGNQFQETSWSRAIQEVAATLKHVLAAHGPRSVAVLASPQMSNEELYFIRRIFKDHLKINNIESKVPSNAAVYSDDFLITADKNPNTRGAQLFLLSGSGSQELLQASIEGNIRFLYIFQQDLMSGHDPAFVTEALAKADCVVFQGSWNNATAALADIQLPAAVYAEKEGTFTNIQGRVQRFHAAVAPLGESLSDLEILNRLALDLDVPLAGTSAAGVLAEIGQTVSAFAGMTWQTVGSKGRLLSRNSGE
jgi:predicted molibdopterin-dependent oxidoreductase YjgC